MKSLFLIFGFCLFFVTNLFAQNSASSAVKTFDKDGLKFNYASDWTITDNSSPDAQSLYLSKEDSSVLIAVSSPRDPIGTDGQFIKLQRNVHEKYIKAISKSLSNSKKDAKEEWLCMDFNGRNVTGTKFTGIYKNESAIGEVYPFALGNRFVTLVYMRTDKDSAIGDPVWNDLVKSLTVNGSNKEATANFLRKDTLEGGILNGKALILVRPQYSKLESQVGAKGDVEVAVEVDEKGKVISAKAISGNKLLYSSAEYAAKNSRFSPTRICDKTVRISGIIVYTFAR